ncbi:2-hydroxychromene-2-carboxylate isomerase [Magnetospirillum sp. SS-4]|uniref:2-hydroxychromene-2-carboxylate isomerase n=1 Tax=Magnetospirillum sp. SS-4 TaxID=2681465 RepID=UPI001381D19F|nr:2-hydroxychromene-2-carboxylate isomerase [Magnetospirillum sp. SS-4]CAA7627546.1 2-hydroxychromene-2-carboxylate isomerase [Magnetospirillum sp. SS-4]
MSDDVEFYFDFSSPYGYFACLRVDKALSRFGRKVAWKPIMIGSAFKASGNLPLVDQPLKGIYSRHDWDRMGRLLKVPYRMPDRFPVASLPPSRAFWWLDGRDPALARRFALAVYHAYFAENRDISETAITLDIAGSLGVDTAALQAALQDPACKRRLKDETEAAIDKGVFGSPFFIVDGEGFWGADRLDMVAEWLERGGW